MLLRYGDMFCILYATHIPNDGFQGSASPMNWATIFWTVISIMSLLMDKHTCRGLDSHQATAMSLRPTTSPLVY